MKGALERQDAIALRMAADPLAPARHLDRRLVGLGPGIGEEHEVCEGRVGQTAGETFAFGILVQVRDVPELRALTGQRLHHVGMGVSDGSHRDSGPEVEIAFARRRDEPAPLSALEGDVCARIGRNDRRSRLNGIHVTSSMCQFVASAAGNGTQNKNAAPLGRPLIHPVYSGNARIWSNERRPAGKSSPDPRRTSPSLRP